MSQDEHRPRKHDHLVEPLFGGLEVPAHDEALPTRRVLPWVGVLVLVALVIWLVI